MLTEVKYEKRIQGEIIDFTMQECGSCGIPFFVPTTWRKNKINEQGTFSCPNGCSRKFISETEEQKLRKELEKEKSERLKSEQQLQDKWLDEMSRANKLDRQLKRVHNGVCPCCKRSFVNLQRHMKTKHPEVVVPSTVDQGVKKRGRPRKLF